MRLPWGTLFLAAFLPTLSTAATADTHPPPSQREVGSGKTRTYARRISVEELEAMQRRAIASEADASAQRFGLFKVERRGRVGRERGRRIDERQNGNALVDSILGGATLASDALAAPTQGIAGGIGGSTPAALAGSVSGGKNHGGGGGNGVQVTEIESSQQTAAGLVTVKCLVLSNDPNDMFCETLIDGQQTGSGMTGSSGTGSGTSSGSTGSGSVSSSSSSSSAVDTTTTSSQAAAVAASSSSIAVSATTSAADSTTASATSAGQDAAAASSASTTQSIDAVVGGAATSAAAASDTTSTGAATAAVTSSSVVAAAAVTAPQLVTSSTTNAAITAGATATGQADAGTAVASVDFTVNAPATTIAAAANNAASTTVDPIPGQSLQVLPIGLGIFGGLAALTLVVVAYFLWQRKRYKGQFRRRKLAEEAAPMGRGGGGYGSAV